MQTFFVFHNARQSNTFLLSLLYDFLKYANQKNISFLSIYNKIYIEIQIYDSKGKCMCSFNCHCLLSLHSFNQKAIKFNFDNFHTYIAYATYIPQFSNNMISCFNR